MKGAPIREFSVALWYLLWSAMLLVAAGNTLCYSPVFSGNWGLAFSGVLAAAAGAQPWLGGKLLPRRQATLSGALLVVFCMAQLVQFARSTSPPSTKRGVDFSAYYLAGKTLSEMSGVDIYQLPLFADGRLNLNAELPASSPWHEAAGRYHVPFAAPFIYPPFFAVMMEPLAHASYASAYVIWIVITMICVIGGTLLSLSVGGVQITGKLALILGVGLFSYYPLFDNLFFGQIGGVILLLFAAGVWLLARNRIGMSAFCFAVATAIKLTPVLVVPVLVMHRRWRWLAAYAVWMAGLVGISMAVTGWTAYPRFWHSALPAISCGSAVWENTSLVSWVQQLFLGYTPFSIAPPQQIPAPACSVSKLAALVVYAGFLLLCWMRRKEMSVEQAMVAMALLGLAISPISWWHHYTIALLPLIYFWCTMHGRLGRYCVAALGLVVGTNVIGTLGEMLPGSAILLVLAGITPILTVAVSFAAVSEGPEVALRPELYESNSTMSCPVPE